MKALLLELLPHAPKMGLYVHPNIPADKLRNALRDYAGSVAQEDVLALYDATLLGNAKDGAVFTADRFVFQNTDLEPPQTVRYEDIVRVHAKRKLLGGKKVFLDVNRGRATIEVTLDFSGKPEAASFVARFLHEAMLKGAALEMDGPEPEAPADASTDPVAVEQALEALRAEGLLTNHDFRRLLNALRERD